MEKIATENLFLLEFLVDNVKLDPKCECDAPPGENCVSFQFLDNSPLDVCEADFCPKRNIKNDDSVKSGKSCLFSLSPEQANQATEQFDIMVSIMRKMQPGWLPDKVEIGAAVISVSNLFNELISSVEMSDGNTPTAKTLKDVFDINDNSGNMIGQISVYIRMSCFGKLIVTQFQMNLDDKSVLFKDKEGKSLYRYKKAGKDKGDKRGSLDSQRQTPGQGQLGYNPTCPQTPCFPDGTNQGESTRPTSGRNTDYECPFAPCPLDGSQPSPPQSAPYNQGGGGFMPPDGYFPGGAMTMSPCNECGGMQAAPCIQPPGQFELVPRGPSLGMPSSAGYGGGYMMQQGFPGQPGFPGQQGFPPPPDGNYQEIGASMGGNSLTIRVHKDKNKIEEVNNEDDCSCGNGQSNGRPLAIGGPQTQTFAMRPGVPNPNSPFSFRMGQVGDARGGDNNVLVNPPVCTGKDGTQFTEFSDPNKEMFILRIGKKSEGIDKKNNLELELQTPKGPPLKPIPRKETVDTQYDSLDCGPETKSGKGKKGKDKKGGKKGKGKKKK